MPPETTHSFLRDLALILGTAALATVVFQRIRVPVIVGYLVAGMLVGPLAPRPLIHDVETIRTLAELGVVLLLFSIGLEFRLRRLLTLGPRVALAMIVEVGLMLLLGYGVARLLGWGTLASLLSAGIVAISSTMVVSGTLGSGADRRLRDIVFGVLVMEDLVAIILIAVLTTVAAGDELSGPMLGATLLRLGAFLVILVAGGMLIVPRAIRAVLALRRPETTLVAALGICFGSAVLSAVAGYSVALGGFIAGALVAESGRHHIVAETIRPVRDLFAAIFFVGVGMLFDPAAVAGQWPVALLFLVVVLAGKLIGVTAGVFLAGYGTRDAVRSGLTLAQIGEFSFVIAGLGAVSAGAGGALTGRLYPIAVAVATVTAFTTPLLVRRADRLAAWVDRVLPHPAQTVASLYASWFELLSVPRPAPERTARRRRLLRFLTLDVLLVTGAIIATAVVYRRLPGWLAPERETLVPALRIAVLAAGAVLALPFAIGLVRTVRRLALLLAESAIPRPARGVDQGLAPRRALSVTLQIALVLGLGAPITVVTLPFVPPFGVLGVIAAYLVVLGVGFWRTATDLERHARAGAELVVHVLGKQSHSGDTGMFETVREMLPGLGTIVPIQVPPGSAAAGKTLGELDLRGRTGATVVALSRGQQRDPAPSADTRVEVGDHLAISGSGSAIGLAAALLLATDTSLPPTDTDASARPAG